VGEGLWYATASNSCRVSATVCRPATSFITLLSEPLLAVSSASKGALPSRTAANSALSLATSCSSFFSLGAGILALLIFCC
jgi:hypothetical protein